MIPSEPSKIKRRDAQATRAKLLESARIVFTERGYEGAGLREICRGAGVDLALIKRYFGSKQKLFEEIFDNRMGMHEILSGPKKTLGIEIANYYVGKSKTIPQFDATIALLHSIGSQKVNNQLKHIVETQFIDRLSLLIGGANAAQRAALIISQIIGFDVLRRVLKVDAMSDEYKSILRDQWAKQIQSLVDDG